MQNPKENGKAPVKFQNADHEKRHACDQKPRAEDDHAAAEAAGGERHADAGDENEKNVAIALAEVEPAGHGEAEPGKFVQVEDKMHDHHAQNTDPAQRVQLPDAVFLRCHACASFSVSSSRTR